MTFDKVFDIIDRASRSVPVDLHRLCSDLGINLQPAELDPEIVGQIENRDGNFTISYNTLNSSYGYRHRFTIAHEIGHYVLHKHLIGNGVDDSKAFRSTAIGKFYNCNILPHHETEANNFAASLLMPEHSLRVDANYMEAYQLADKYEVSLTAMNYRLRNLSINPVQ